MLLVTRSYTNLLTSNCWTEVVRFLLDPRRRVLIAHPRNLQSKGLDHICFTRLGCFKRLLIPRRKQKVKALHSRFVYSTPPSQSRGTAPFQSTPPNLKLAKVPQNSQRAAKSPHNKSCSRLYPRSHRTLAHHLHHVPTDFGPTNLTSNLEFVVNKLFFQSGN